MISEGDRVKFLNDTGGGVVISLDDPKMAIVLIDEGFEVPVPVSELIPVPGESSGKYSSQNTGPGTGSRSGKGIPARDAFDVDGDQYDEDEEDKVDEVIQAAQGYEADPADPADQVSSDYGSPPGKKKAEVTTADAEEFGPGAGSAERNILGGLVEAKHGSELELWLINDSSLMVFYTLLRKDDPSWLNIASGNLDPETKIRVCTFSREEVNSFITLKFQALFYMEGIYDPVSPSQADLRLDPVDIYSDGSFTINDFFEENARILPVISDQYDREVRKAREQEISRLIAGKVETDSKDKDSRKKKTAADPLVEEVDLHIGELLEDHSSLSGKETLDIQMARFTTALEGALRGKTRRIVFIHGIGQGKLKYEIRKTLDKKYPKLRYQDASFKEYGYGATMIIIRK
ncbi:MAG: DUF2027 domain-containing protein [Marinilabiliales bacterium]|nr:MAG: DUF2027 domain-containing protein [Marinilabiliales bacterium]